MTNRPGWLLQARPAIKKIGKYWFFLLIVAALAFAGRYLVREAGSIHHPLHFSAGSLVATLFLQATYWFLTSLLWKRIVAKVSAYDISVKESFYQLCLVSIGKYLPGKIWGMVARGSHMKRRHGIAPEQIINATYVEQFFVLYAGVLVIAVTLALTYVAFWTWILVLVAIAGAVVGQRYNQAIVLLISRVYAWSGRRGKSGRPVGKIEPWTFYGLLLSYVAIWLLVGLVFIGVYCTFFSAPLNYRIVCTMILANAVGYTAGFLAIFAPGGIGVREAVSSGLLALQMPLASAVLLSVLFRLWLVTTEIALGLVAFLGSGWHLVSLTGKSGPADDG